MLFGYVEEGSYNIKNDEDEPILTATYYYGTNEDGARHSGWLQYTDALPTIDDADNDKSHDYYWFYFNTSNGKMVKDDMKTINGKKYHFDTNGIMSYEWDEGTVSGKTSTVWYGALEDGSLAKNKWIWTSPDKNSVEIESNKDDANDDVNRWFRTTSAGELVKGKTKKVNSKWYAFDEDGVMRTGLMRLSDPAVSGASVSGYDAEVKADEYLYGVYDMDTVTKDELQAVPAGYDDTDADQVEAFDYWARSLHYFSEEEEKDGSMKTGTIKIELADDTRTFCFTKNTGAAKHGLDSKKIYNNGILEKAGDDKYKVVKNPIVKDGQSQYYLVGTTGNIVTSVNKYKDANDKYYVLVKNGNQYEIGSTYDEDVAKDAVKDKSIDGLYVESDF